MSKKRIGILTSGGDCPGLNAVIRGSVKACHQLGYDCVGFLKGYEGLYDPVQYVHLTQNSTRGILNQGGTILGSTNKGRFAATVGVQDRQELDPDLLEGVKQTIEQLGIDGLICVGGDGSLAVAQQFHEQGIPVVGVPKTIDNDLSATAFTFGFDSAIECATDALDRLHTTAASHERIMVLEVMGRHAGWIALHSGIAGGGDIILIPEVEWNYENVCHKILHRESQGKRFTLVVVAEGAHLPDTGLVGESRDGQQMKLGGVGRAVAEEIEQRLHRETRLSVLGHLQRGGSPTTFDRVLATQFGAHAVRLVKEGRFGEMICSRPPDMTSVPIMEAVNVLRQVDPNGPAVQAARALGISFGDRAADEIGQDVFGRRESAIAVGTAAAAGAPADAKASPADDAPFEAVEEALANAAQVIDLEPSPETLETAPAAETPRAEAFEAGADTALEVAVEEDAIDETPDEEPATEVSASLDIESVEADALSEVKASDEEGEPAEAEGPAAEQPVAEEPAAEEPIAEATDAEETLAEEVAEAATAEKSIEDEEVAEAEPAGLPTGEPVAADPVAEELVAEDAPSEEDDAVESVAETMLDLVADADAAAHGADSHSEPDDEPTDAQESGPTEAVAGESAEVSETETLESDAVETDAAESGLEVDTTDEAEASPVEPADDFAEAQAALAQRIAGAAQATRNDVPADTVLDPSSAELNVAELVKQKLAEVTLNAQAADPEAVDEPAKETAAEVAETLASPADQPFEEDLLAEARSALEEALSD